MKAPASLQQLVMLASAAVFGSCAEPARVVDGETLIAGTVHYRLWGIAAPDMHQTCADGWPAGEEAKRMLETMVSGHRIVCEAKGWDRYRRTLGLCRAGGQDLAAGLVGAGMAWSLPEQSPAYVGIERDAREERRGVHAHDCDLPES